MRSASCPYSIPASSAPAKLVAAHMVARMLPSSRRRAGGARDRERRLADLERLDPAAQEHEQVALGGEHARTARGVAVRRGSSATAARQSSRPSSELPLIHR